MPRSLRARRRLALLALPALVFLFGPGCGDDDSSGPSDVPVEVPAAWAGIWEIESVERDCGSSVILNEEAEVDTLCAGEPILFSDDDTDSLVVDCEGTVTDTRIDVTCTSSGTYEGITYTITVDVTMERDGNSMSGTARFTVRIGDEVVDCTQNTLTGTRIAPAPDPCISSSARLMDRRIRTALADARTG